MKNDNIYTIDEILQIAEGSYNLNPDRFLKDRNYKKLREEVVYAALFLRGQQKYYSKRYKIKLSENPDCIAIDKNNKKNEIGFEIMVINKYNLDNSEIGSDVADFIFNKKGLNNYGSNCYLLIPIIKEGKIDINLTNLQQGILRYKKLNYFNYKDVLIIYWEFEGQLRRQSLFKDLSDLNYQI